MLSTEAAEILITRKSIPVLDSQMIYLDTGDNSDKTVHFLHGNPTAARCVAPDLIGQGHSGKQPQNQYHFRDHYRYLCEWIEKMQFPGKLNLVVHDWGSGLGFHWANQHRNHVESITFMEALTDVVPNWEYFPELARKAFQNLRSPAGEEMVLKNNFFIEKLLPLAIQRELSEEEMNEYRRPFLEAGESRRPTLTWPREIPVRTEGPQDVIDIIDDYREWLRTDTNLPKLYVDAEPGFFSPTIRISIRDWPNLKTAKAPGSHFLQEDSPDEIGKAINEFLLNDVFKKGN